MHQPDVTTLWELGEHPFVLIQCPPTDDDGFDLQVKAEGIDDRQELAALLLLVVEQITGVSTDDYMLQADIARSAARIRS